MRKPPRHIIFPFLAFSFLLLTISAEAQQLKLGNNPTVIDPSAVLQLESPNQGLLLTRVPDTSVINAFSPPDGMIIYFTDGATSEPYGPNAGVYERKNGKWQRVLFAGDGSIGIVSLNGSIVPAQTFATGTSGTGFNISTNVATGVHTFNIPIASTADTGLVNIGAQTFGGAKTFANTLTLGQSLITNGSFGNDGQVLRSRGVINISPTWENLLLDSLYNVKISSPQNGDILQFNSITNKWVNANSTNSSSWSLNGNNNVTSTNYLGTINNQALVFKVGTTLAGTIGTTITSFTFLGFGSSANNVSSTAIGSGSQASGQYSTALGTGAIASAKNSTAIGSGAQATQQNTLILGNGANVGIGTPSPGTLLQVNGVVTATNYVTTSDIRYKKNLQELRHVLSAIDSLHGYTYFFRTKEFKDKNFPATKQIGMIAQEVEKYFPELVSTDKEGYKSLNYAQFTAVLLEAIKEQQVEIAALKKQNEENEENEKNITGQLKTLAEKVEALEKMVEKK